MPTHIPNQVQYSASDLRVRIGYQFFKIIKRVNRIDELVKIFGVACNLWQQVARLHYVGGWKVVLLEESKTYKQRHAIRLNELPSKWLAFFVIGFVESQEMKDKSYNGINGLCIEEFSEPY